MIAAAGESAEPDRGAKTIAFRPIYTDAHLIAELRRTAAAVDGPVTVENLRSHSSVHPQTVTRRFGSWKSALVAAGLSERYSGRAVTPKMREQASRKLSDREILDELRRIASLTGGRYITRAAVRTRSDLLGLRVVVDRFGGWPTAVAAAGLAQRPRANVWTEDALLTRLAALQQRIGRPVRATDIDREPEMASSHTYKSRFGSVTNALSAATERANRHTAASSPEASPGVFPPNIRSEYSTDQSIGGPRTTRHARALSTGVSELVVVRHGQSTANLAFATAAAAGLLDAGVVGRDVDVDLSALGWQQAAALGRWLRIQPEARVPQVVISSPYRRALQTWQRAVDVAAAGGRRPPAALVDERLGDRRMGQLELMTAAAVAHLYGGQTARRLALRDFSYRPPGGGESFADIADRVRSLVDDLHRHHPGRRVLLVAHDAVVLMLRFVVERLTVEQLATIADTQPVANASITHFVARRGGLQLDRYNMTDHLDGAALDSGGTASGGLSAEVISRGPSGRLAAMAEGTATGPEDSFLSGMAPIHLGLDAAEEYEVTRRLLEQVMGLASSRRVAAKQADPVDEAAVRAADELGRRFAPLMISLDPTDTAEVARVRAECIALLRRARGLDA